MTFFLLWHRIELNDDDQFARKSHYTVYDVVTVAAQLAINEKKNKKKKWIEPTNRAFKNAAASVTPLFRMGFVSILVQHNFYVDANLMLHKYELQLLGYCCGLTAVRFSMCSSPQCTRTRPIINILFYQLKTEDSHWSGQALDEVEMLPPGRSWFLAEWKSKHLKTISIRSCGSSNSFPNKKWIRESNQHGN